MKKFILFLTVYCSLFSVRLCFSQTDSSYKYLDINDVNARINSSGLLFWSTTATLLYEVPKGSGKKAMDAANLWIGGLDLNHNLHFAGDLFRYYGHDFFYGPIMDSLNYKKDYKQWNNTWKINKSTIDSFKANWSTPGYKIPVSILNWPANGDTTLGQSRKLAPYFDNDNDWYYNPAKGDYPVIRGDQAVYFIINDDSIHTDSKGSKLKIEVHGMAYAFNNPSDSALNQTTFLNYQIINRSLNNYDSVYIGAFADIDIGDCFDDYIGCDTSLNSYFGYNGKPCDGNGEPYCYGLHPPAQSVTFLNKKINFFMYFNDVPDPISGDPRIAKQYHNLLQARWEDGQHLIYGGSGLPDSVTTNQKTNFAFPGDLTDSMQWSEISAKDIPYDRRGIGSIGPISLNKGETKCFDIAYVWARDYTGDNISSVTLLKQRIAAIQYFYNNNIASNCDDITINAVNELNEITNNYIKVFPNPADNYINILTGKRQEARGNSNYTLYNIMGQKVNSGKINSPNTRINVSGLNEGLYILKLNSNDYDTSRKIVIRH